MARKSVTFYKAKNLNEALYHLKNVSNLKIYGGGTTIKSNENHTLLDTGNECMYLSNIAECTAIDKRERYIEFGGEVTLTQILNLGSSNLPDFFYSAIKSIAKPLIQNVATIAGNICAKDFYHTLYSPLLAVDAKLEIQNSEESRIIPISKFNGIENGQILTKIRFPIIDWDIADFTRLGPNNEIIDVSAFFTFLAKTQKDTIIDLRIAFCGKIKIRSTELENLLIGSKVPINQKTISNVMEFADKLFDETVNFGSEQELQEKIDKNIKSKQKNDKIDIIHPILKQQFLNLLKKNLEKLT
ncbi:MAG: FAD binding domain-containing protein [Treponemataceae bacterium]